MTFLYKKIGSSAIVIRHATSPRFIGLELRSLYVNKLEQKFTRNPPCEVGIGNMDDLPGRDKKVLPYEPRDPT